jgi:exopolysaccharide biosynthesis polyprenyl glycosylphosphotransferase
MKGTISLVYSFFLVMGDFFALVLAFVGAYILRVTLDARPLIEDIPARNYLMVFLVLLPFWLLIFALLGLYSSTIYERRFSEIGRLFMGSFLGLLFVIGYSYLLNKAVFPARLVPIYGFLLAFIFLVIFRNIIRGLRSLLYRHNIGITRVLLVGSSNATVELYDSLHSSRVSGYKVVGIVGKPREEYGRTPVFSSFQEADKAIKSGSMQSIVQTELYPDNEKNNEILGFAQSHHVAYRFVPGNAELFAGNIAVELFRGSLPVVAVHQTALLGWGRVLKRLFDLVSSSLLIVFVSPIMLMVAILIKLEDGGPVFLRQARLTRFNQEFRVFKFRTNNTTYNGLTPEEAFAKMNRPDLLKKFRDNGNFLAKDPRNTKIGAFLRKTSLDELPQLFNVITGDLSLVGPRALIPQDLETYEKKHAILSVKSGITGLAQVSGRNNIPFEERRQLDVYYVQNWTFWLDIVILTKTLRVILTSEDSDKVIG